MDGDVIEYKTGAGRDELQQISAVQNDHTQLWNGHSSLVDLEEPPMVNKQSIGTIDISNSSNIHVGTDLKADKIMIKKIDANNITIFQGWNPSDIEMMNGKNNLNKAKVLKDQPKKKIGKLKWRNLQNSIKSQIVLCSIYAAIVLVIIILLLVWLFDKKSSSGHTITTTASPFTTATPPTPPTDWYVNVSEWSSNATPVDTAYVNHAKKRLAFDDIQNLGSCYDKEKCIYILTILQTHTKQENNTNYNYIIGGDGRVYEGRGNNFPPDKEEDFSESFIKIAFIGQFTNNVSLNSLQKQVFDRLVEVLVFSQELESSYLIEPQCCRNIPRETGPAQIIIDYMEETYSSHMTPESCPCIIDNTSTTEGHWFWYEEDPNSNVF